MALWIKSSPLHPDQESRYVGVFLCALPPLHYSPLHYNALHYGPLHYNTLHYNTLHYSPLHYDPSVLWGLRSQAWPSFPQTLSLSSFEARRAS